jgi:Pyridoxamine 5'-phosphate oxidase
MKSSPSPVYVTAELKAFLESGVSVVVGTRDSELVPEITRAWGPRVSRDRRSVSLCIALATSGRTLDNLRHNGRVAATFSLPIDYKTVQLKGGCTETAQPNRQDLAAIQRHRDSFACLTERLGVPRSFTEAIWQRELTESPVMVKIRFVTENVFDQTPGPDAGSPL